MVFFATDDEFYKVSEEQPIAICLVGRSHRALDRVRGRSELFDNFTFLPASPGAIEVK
jgi:hypothetical protein